MSGQKIRTVFQERHLYSDYILYDTHSVDQMSVLLNLNELHYIYYNNGIVDSSYSDPNTYFTTDYNVNWTFECYKMKKAIIYKRNYHFNNSVTPSLTRQANEVFLLAMIYGNHEIVKYFVHNKLININQSIFGSSKWPSYFILACTCTDQILNIFKAQKIKYNIGWNGLTPFIISGFTNIKLEKTSYMDYISYRQFSLLHKYRNVHLAHSIDSLPVFVLDFACMTKNRHLIKEILELIPEAGILSRLSFIVQSEENLFLILSRFDFRNDQNFNGDTPLHFSCYNEDLCAISLLLFLGFPIVQNLGNKFPNEIGSQKIKEKASLFFNLCTTEIASNSKSPKRVFLYSTFQDKMEQMMEILKFNPKDFDKYIGIFRYLKFNRNNKIVTNSRFNIINLLTMSKTPVSVEQSIRKMAQPPFYEKVFSADQVVGLYYRVFKYNY